jgi:hypothetical protein
MREEYLMIARKQQTTSRAFLNPPSASRMALRQARTLPGSSRIPQLDLPSSIMLLAIAVSYFSIFVLRAMNFLEENTESSLITHSIILFFLAFGLQLSGALGLLLLGWVLRRLCRRQTGGRTH